MEMVQKNRGSIPKLWPMFEPETVRKMMTNLKILWFLLAWDPKIIQLTGQASFDTKALSVVSVQHPVVLATPPSAFSLLPAVGIKKNRQLKLAVFF